MKQDNEAVIALGGVTRSLYGACPRLPHGGGHGWVPSGLVWTLPSTETQVPPTVFGATGCKQLLSKAPSLPGRFATGATVTTRWTNPCSRNP